jgi:hypothetical protein
VSVRAAWRPIRAARRRWDKRHLDYAVANAEKIAAILPLHFSLIRLILPVRYVMLASRRNNRTLSGVMINADAGLGIRGIRHVAAGLDL